MNNRIKIFVPELALIAGFYFGTQLVQGQHSYIGMFVMVATLLYAMGIAGSSQ